MRMADSPHTSVSADILLTDQIQQLNFIISQKKKLEQALTEEEKSNRLIKIKLRALDQKIDTIKSNIETVYKNLSESTKDAEALLSSIDNDILE